MKFRAVVSAQILARRDSPNTQTSKALTRVEIPEPTTLFGEGGGLALQLALALIRSMRGVFVIAHGGGAFFCYEKG